VLLLQSSFGTLLWAWMPIELVYIWIMQILFKVNIQRFKIPRGLSFPNGWIFFFLWDNSRNSAKLFVFPCFKHKRNSPYFTHMEEEMHVTKQ
jgi:hypothetical protein